MPDTPPNAWDMVLAGLARVESRLDKLVTMEVHQADIRRLDERITGVVSDLGVDRQMRSEQNAARDARLDALTEGLAQESQNRRDAIEQERQRRQQAMRWGVGLFVPVAVTVVIAAIQTFGG